MNRPTARWHDLDLLLDRVLDGLYSEDDARRLNDILRSDGDACRHYAAYVELHGRLAWGDGFQADPERKAVAGDARLGDLGFGIWDLEHGNPKSQIPNHQIPLSPLTVGGPVFSYIAATLILGVMLLSAWAYKITHDYSFSFTQNSSIAKNSRGLTAPGEPAQRPDPIFVARVTGMKDCRWADRQTETYGGAFVSLGRKYALASGLMEITYRSGAKVILEGPCRYEVESTAGGYLALGKLTAKVEKRSEVRGWRSEAGGLAASAASAQPQAAKPQALRPKTEISKFSVRTPTAVVTDLGTEFGVEVFANGDTASHVFQGRVVVRVGGPAASAQKGLAASAASGAGQIILAAGESARVEKDAKTGDARIVSKGNTGATAKFVRRLREPPKYLDLLDIVAGGNGRGNRRERGIDPSTGEVDFEFYSLKGGYRIGNRQYSPAAWSKYIDGVFIPDGGAGAVQIDSAGSVFDGFPATSGKCFGSIWSRTTDAPNDQTKNTNMWIYAIGRPRQFMPGNRGLLGMHANSGMTFDLESKRKMLRRARPERFHAFAGVADARGIIPEADGSADLWIFVDGRLTWKRLQLRPADGPVEVDVALDTNDRFLTLAVTDGGRTRSYPWAVFGDPVLEFKTTEDDINIR